MFSIVGCRTYFIPSLIYCTDFLCLAERESYPVTRNPEFKTLNLLLSRRAGKYAQMEVGEEGQASQPQAQAHRIAMSSG